jgi:hypothetical protein
MTYLNRLRELLEEEKQKTEESMPQPDPGQGTPKQEEPGENEPKVEPKGDQGDQGEPKPKPSDGKGEDDQNPKDGAGDKEKKPDTENGPKKEEPMDQSKEGKAPKPNPDESPEEQAKRILKENSDLEKGPITPGHREFRNPEKDW